MEACVATWEAVGQDAPFGSIKLVKGETGDKSNYSWLLPEVTDLSGKVLKFRMRAEAPVLVKPWLRTTRLSSSDVWGKYANASTFEVGTEWVDLEFDLSAPAWADPTFDPATAFHVGIEWWTPTVPLWLDAVWMEDAT
jgi:hypothetical protein